MSILSVLFICIFISLKLLRIKDLFFQWWFELGGTLSISAPILFIFANHDFEKKKVAGDSIFFFCVCFLTHHQYLLDLHVAMLWISLGMTSYSYISFSLLSSLLHPFSLQANRFDTTLGAMVACVIVWGCGTCISHLVPHKCAKKGILKLTCFIKFQSAHWLHFPLSLF